MPSMPDVQRQFALRLYRVLAVAMLVASLVGLARFRTALRRGFGGFIWQYDPTRGHTVSFEVPRHWPGPQAGLKPHTHIAAINGQDPMEFSRIYATQPIGTPITYDIVTIDGQQLRTSVPVTRFNLSHLLEGYGIIFLVGITFSIGGYILLSSARTTGRQLIGFVMLFAANTAFYHSHNGNVDRFYNRPIFPAVMGSPPNGMLGALLWHLAFAFPRRSSWLERYRWLVPVIYGSGSAISTLLGLTFYFSDARPMARLQFPVQVASIIFLTSGVAASLVRGAIELMNDDQRSETERRQMRIMAVSWSLAGSILVLALGAANLRIAVPYDLITAVAAIMPIGLVLAISGSDLIAELEEKNELRGQLLEQLDELQRLRERALDDIAMELHDSALAESKALEIRLYTLLRQTTEGRIDATVLRDALGTIHAQGVGLGRTLRKTVDGAKPVDLSVESLESALERLVFQMNAGGTTRYTCRISAELDDVPQPIQETIFSLARTALNNVRDHAQAPHCWLELTATSLEVMLTVTDDGVGIREDSAQRNGQPARRQLGLATARARVAHLGGEFLVENLRPGTRFRAVIPL